MYLLDTDVISEPRRPKPHGAVVTWLENVEDRDLHISAVTLGEIQAGIEITREQDSDKARQIEQRLDLVSPQGREASAPSPTPIRSAPTYPLVLPSPLTGEGQG